MQITRHFSLRELTHSNTAQAKGIRQCPPIGSEMDNLKALAERLEQIRALIGAPIIISSGFRSAAVNAAVGGSKTSDHMTGHAADIRAEGITPRKLYTTLKKAMEEGELVLDQLIGYKHHVHVSASPRNRKEAWLNK